MELTVLIENLKSLTETLESTQQTKSTPTISQDLIDSLVGWMVDALDDSKSDILNASSLECSFTINYDNRIEIDCIEDFSFNTNRLERVISNVLTDWLSENHLLIEE